VPGGSVTGNNKVWRQFTFSPITTNKIRVVVNAGADNAFSRVVEVEAWANGSSGSSSNIHWLVPDHLGTPRIILDQTGLFANLRRHDYLPFGEELPASTAGRIAAMGYEAGAGVRQQFTQKERYIETGLDYFPARYYSSTQGRFTSPDEFQGGPDELYLFAEHASVNPTFYADPSIPQSLNKYQYTYNNPTNLTDDDGHCPPCLAAAAAILILTSADTTNAPGPDDPKYRSGDGVKTMMTSASVGVIAGPILQKVLQPVARAVANKLSSKAAERATMEEAVQVANKAQKLDPASRPGAAGAAQSTSGQMFTATSSKGASGPVLHPTVQKILDKIPQASRGPAHGRCCEPQLVSKMLNGGVNPKGATFSIVRVREVGNVLHGTALKPCPSCELFLKAINK
jgi:RHS repeat-associated protein